MNALCASRWVITACAMAAGAMMGGSGDSFAQVLPLTLSSASPDPNGFPVNPHWAYQEESAQLLDAEAACDRFRLDSGSSGVRNCTGDAVAYDLPQYRRILPEWVKLLCNTWDGRLTSTSAHGHINWRTIAYRGRVRFEDYQFTWGDGLRFGVPMDGDYDFFIAHDDKVSGTKYRDLYLAGNGPREANDGITVEFSDRETLGRFAWGWWQKFRSLVFAHGKNFEDARKMVGDNEGVVVGLLGIDTKHRAHVELHPMYAITFHAGDNAQGEQIWPVLVRNWGSEGGCSSEAHPLNLSSDLFRLMIPSVEYDIDIARSHLYAYNESVKWSASVSDAHVIAVIQMPSASQEPLVVGELVLRRTVRRF